MSDQNLHMVINGQKWWKLVGQQWYKPGTKLWSDFFKWVRCRNCCYWIKWKDLRIFINLPTWILFANLHIFKISFKGSDSDFLLFLSYLSPAVSWNFLVHNMSVISSEIIWKHLKGKFICQHFLENFFLKKILGREY